ncbi:MAG: TorF family putative porin [Parvularculaceae bacterium]
MRCVLCVAVFCSLAAAPVVAEETSLTASVGVESRYVIRGYQLAAASVQSSATLRIGGFYAGFWHNLPLERDIAPALYNLEELDLAVGFGATIAPRLSLELGATYYAYPDIAHGYFDIFKEDQGGAGANSAETFVTLALEAPLSPKLYLFRDFMYDTFTLQAGLSQAFSVGGPFGIELSGAAGYVVDDVPSPDYVYGSAAANLTLGLADGATAFAGVRFGGSTFAGGLIHDGAVAGTTKPAATWFGAGLSATF